MRIETSDGQGRILAVTEVPDDPTKVTRRTLEDRATQALDANRAFLALQSPTNAQTLAQVRSLTRQNTALIRLLLGRLDATG